MSGPHQGSEPVLAGAPLDRAPVAAVVVHGRDQGPEPMLELVERLALPEVAYLLPAAAGGSWYPARYTAPLEDNEPWLGSALEAVGATIDRAAAGRAPGRVAVVGFSQGACLLAELVARAPRALGTVCLLTGALIGPARARSRPVAGLDGLDVFLGIAEADAWVALADAQETARRFAAAGARVDLRVYDDVEHAVNDDEVAAVRRRLRALAP